MNESLSPKPLKATLEAIRDMATNALSQIEQSEERSMRWKCKECRYIKRFTRPVPLEAAGRCLRAKAQSLDLFCERLEIRSDAAIKELAFSNAMLRPCSAGFSADYATNLGLEHVCVFFVKAF